MNHPNRLRLLAAAMAALLLQGCGTSPHPSTGPTQTTAPAAQTQPAEPTQSPETVLPEDSVTLALGEYLVNAVMLDEGGVSNDDCGVRLRDDGTCMLYMGWGIWFEGPYEIHDAQLICSADKLEWDGGGGPGSRETDVVFTFAIRGENLLELTEIQINDPESADRVAPYAFSIGMTYSIPRS